MGVLHDVWTVQQPNPSNEQPFSMMPWRVTVHTTAYPRDRLLEMESEQTVCNVFMSRLKEVREGEMGAGLPFILLLTQGCLCALM